MAFGRFKSLSVAVFGLLLMLFSTASFAQDNPDSASHLQREDKAAEKADEKGGAFNANEVIFGHVMDAHQFHFFSWKGSEGEQHHAIIPLPILLYEPGRGVSFFSSSKFHHGEEAYNGYRVVTESYRENLKEKGMEEDQIRLLQDEQIVAVDNNGTPISNIKVYDLSITRNVVQMFIALTILVLLMTSIAKRYRTGQGLTSAPKGWQNAVEPVIQFIRDEVAKPNIGHRYKRYMPLLLTIFFFILINNIFGLIPGSANVTGNIAFTATLGVISFLVITFSANKHYWGHIFNPPVPFGIKFIMVPVEILSIFTKPFALIIRLFANMLAGHIIIICLVSLIFIFGNLSTGVGIGFSPISIAFAVFIYVIEILVAFIQAFIFTNLTAVFIGQATEDHHQHEADAHHGNPPTEPVII
ncbi:F0F1 ATP synthase subunit A [Flavisolibacter nicotianae]|uniref:F0F1 ATP synthase subunit A n=1 Tax=Flavisolibacter nicotianae TaxID=2364882 RepID=UPI001F09F19A|nr:F0F1 ATP synthase subunit A [Flavisolibacter nicotianae]